MFKKIKIGKFRLKNYRSYDEYKTDFSDFSSVVFYGDNGAGKTNILEAISLLSVGTGLRRAKLVEIGNINNSLVSRQWTVFSEVDIDGEFYKIGTSYDYGNDKTQKKRVISVDGDKLAVQSDVLDFVRVVSLVPWMDRIFQDASAERRKFFDSFIEQFYKSHNETMNDYNALMKQRSKLLKKLVWDEELLNIIEKEMVEKGVAIAANRISYVAKLNKLLEDVEGLPGIIISLNGFVEEGLKSMSAYEVEELFLAKLLENRVEFKESFSPHVPGIHRTDFIAFNLDKKINVELTSTGEQKLVVVSIILQNIELIKLNFSQAPLVLIDEAVAHLDQDKKQYFFSALEKSGCQCFFTGVALELFDCLKNKTTLFIEIK